MALPTPTPATAPTGYIPAGVRRYVFVPTIATQSAPTSAEITAGTEYTSVMVGTPGGFSQSSDSVSNANYGSRFNSTIPGAISSDDSTWTLEASKTSTDARQALTQDLNGYVVNFNEGIGTSNKMDVWPVRISSSNVDQVDRDALSTITVDFAITGTPSLGVAVPTA